MQVVSLKWVAPGQLTMGDKCLLIVGIYVCICVSIYVSLYVYICVYISV